MTRTSRQGRGRSRMVHSASTLALVCVAGGLLPASTQRVSAQADRAPLSGTLTFYASQYTPTAPTTSNPHPATYLGTIVKNYEALHPGVTIKLLPNVTSTTVSVDQWKTTQFAGNTEPDIIYNNPVEANNKDVSKGWYLPLDTYLAQPDPYVKGNKHWSALFPASALANVTNANGHNYNLPMDAIDTAIFYNKKAFAKAGIAHPPTTWAEMMSDMSALKAAGYSPLFLNAGATGTDYMDWWERQIDDMLFGSEAAKFHALPGGAKGTYQLTVPQMVRAIKSGLFSTKDPRFVEDWALLKQLASYAQPGFAGVSSGATSSDALFAAQKVAMFEGTTADVKALQDLHLTFPWSTFMAIPPITSATSPLATGKQAGRIGIVGAFANYNISIATTNRDHNLPLALDFLHYLSQPTTGGKMITQLGIMVPVLKGVPIPSSLKVFIPSVARHDCLLPGFNEQLDVQYATGYYKVLQLYLLGQISESAALSQVQQLMTAGADRVAAAEHIQ
jgi:raffinose/stachyose/melibiose transport system substrate-binding protein